MAQTDVQMEHPPGNYCLVKQKVVAIYLQESMLVKYSRELVPNIFISYPTRSAIECNIPLQ
jgi:hypothetical protein